MNSPERIEPRPFSFPAGRPDRPADGGPGNGLLLMLLLLVGVAVGLVVLVFLRGSPPPAPGGGTPALVAPAVARETGENPPPAVPQQPAPLPEAPTPPSPPGLSGAALEQAKRFSDEALAELLEARKKLEGLAAGVWGDAAWSNAVGEATAGDAAYLAKNFDEATRRFRAATLAMRDLGDAAPLALPRIVRAGEEAIARGDSADATRLLEAARAIAPDDPALQGALKRAETASATAACLRAGAEQEAAGQNELAFAAYSEALRLDAAFPGVKEAHERLRSALGSSVLRRMMSEGMRLYHAGDFEGARARFLEARSIRRDLPEVTDALRLAEDAVRLQKLASARTRAEEEEKAERHDAALGLYNEALAIDPSVAFALEGRERAINALRITRQLDAFLQQPETLHRDASLRAAQAALGEAMEVKTPGPVLQGKMLTLAAAIRLAVTPVPVQITSDGKTEVVILRGETLGRFKDKTVMLRPGTHVLTGIREGHLDVRVEIRVAPARETPPVDVSCKERI